MTKPTRMNLLTRLSLILLVAAFVLQQCEPRKFSDRRISADEVYGIINDSVKVNGYVVLDIRSRMDYIRGHLVSAFWISPDSIESKIAIILNERRPLIIYDSGEILEQSEVPRILAAHGVTNFSVMGGGFSEWIKRGYPAAIQLVRNTSERIDIPRKDISAAEAYEMLRPSGAANVIVDVRPYPAFSEAHIQGARSIPYVPINEFVVNVEAQDLARNRPVIIYADASSDTGEKAAEVMLRNDFLQVYLLKGGIGEWALKNYPLEYRK